MAVFASRERPIDRRSSEIETAPPRPTPQGPTLAAPLIVLAIAGALAATHLLLAALPRVTAFQIEWALSLSPLMVRQGLANGAPGALLPLATHMLLHANLVHLLFNIAWMLPLGAAVARRLGSADYEWGGAKSVLLFLALFIGGGVAGGLAFMFFNLNSATPAVGASGAIFALLGAAMRFWTGREMPRGASDAPIVPLSHPFLIRMTLANVALNLLMGFLPQILGAGRIAWEAHLGGYFFGLLAFPLFARAAAR
ncbi:MAG: rhomboid family intramembrane serine protease [Parvularculaceae bacterium]|jgi:membrane associated rhomboid family serine protease|nr:rhomboid family intramembrane serine protease [Parvularculaceae bacterium]